MSEFLVVFVFLAPFFLSFAAYRMYLERDFGDPWLRFGMALVNALVLSKVVLIGEMAKLGEGHGNRPLLLVTLRKSAVFAVFYLAFHVVEEGIHGLLHGEAFLDAAADVFRGPNGLAIRMLFVFFAFIPFFALRESRRVIGEERFRDLFLRGPER